jgi:hypothetical protein
MKGERPACLPKEGNIKVAQKDPESSMVGWALHTDVTTFFLN